MGVNGEESSAGCVELDKRLPEQDFKKEEDVGCREEGQVKEEKKTSDAILDDLFSTIRESGAVSFENNIFCILLIFIRPVDFNGL